MIAPWDVGVWVVNTIEDILKNLQTILEGFKTVATTGGVPIIRHIQRGTVTIGETYNTGISATVTLSGFTNINKMIVILDGVGSHNGSDYDSSYAIVYGPYLRELSTTSMELRTDNRAAGNTISYQVIELW